MPLKHQSIVVACPWGPLPLSTWSPFLLSCIPCRNWFLAKKRYSNVFIAGYSIQRTFKWFHLILIPTLCGRIRQNLRSRVLMTCLHCRSKFTTKLRLNFSLLIQNLVLPTGPLVKIRDKGQAAVSMKWLPASHSPPWPYLAIGWEGFKSPQGNYSKSLGRGPRHQYIVKLPGRLNCSEDWAHSFKQVWAY